MKNTAYLQWIKDGMGEPLFNYANTENGQKVVQMARKFMFDRKSQIKELLLDYTRSYALQLAIDAFGLPDTEESILEFLDSEDFDCIHMDIIKTIEDNYKNLMKCLNSKDKRRLNSLFK